MTRVAKALADSNKLLHRYYKPMRGTSGTTNCLHNFTAQLIQITAVTMSQREKVSTNETELMESYAKHINKLNEEFAESALKNQQLEKTEDDTNAKIYGGIMVGFVGLIFVLASLRP